MRSVGALKRESNVADVEVKSAESDQEEEVFEFSTVRKPVLVTVDGEKYELRYMTGEQVGTYRNSVGQRMKFGANGKPSGFSNYKGLESGLICLCMYHVATGAFVTPKVIDGWPQDIIDKIFRKCRKMNALDDEGEKTEKKD